MDLLHAFLFLYYFINFLCSAVPRFVTVGCCFVLLICRLLRVVIWLMVREIRMVFAESQDALGQDDQAVTSLREHCRQMHLVYQDLNMAGAASQEQWAAVTSTLRPPAPSARAHNRSAAVSTPGATRANDDCDNMHNAADSSNTGHDLIGAALQSAEDCVEADLLARSSPDASLHSVISLPNINKLPYEYPLGSSLPWVDPTGVDGCSDPDTTMTSPSPGPVHPVVSDSIMMDLAAVDMTVTERAPAAKLTKKKLKKIVGGNSDDDDLRAAQKQAVRFSNKRRC